MALPDAFTLARANKASLDSGGHQEFGKCPNLSLALWEVAAD
jgi:hypothetical protein